MMPAGHHSDSDSILLPIPKSAITWFGGIFARLPPLAAGLCGNRTAMALLLTTDEQAKFPKLLLVRRSIGNANRVGQRCVGQPEELRSEDQMTRENASAP